MVGPQTHQQWIQQEYDREYERFLYPFVLATEAAKSSPDEEFEYLEGRQLCNVDIMRLYAFGLQLDTFGTGARSSLRRLLGFGRIWMLRAVFAP